MKKWGIIVLLFFFVVIWQAVSVYRAAMAPKETLIAKAEQRAVEEANLSHVQAANTYYGEKAYVVVEGTDEKGTKKIVWVPAKGGHIVVKRTKSGITKQEAIEKLNADRQPKQIISAKLGMEKGVPLWELTYIEQDNRYSFYYLSFEDGAFLKRYSFQQ